MTRALVRSREHLLANRRVILAYALGAAGVGLVPVPYVDDWLPALVRRKMVRRIADSRGVDVSDAAVREIAEGQVGPPGWRTVAGIPFARLARRAVRAALVAWNLYRRAEAASRTFALGTLFDHYCARQHVGGELDADAARVLRARFDAVVRSSSGSLPAWAVRRGFASGLRALARAPLSLVERLRGAPEGVQAEEIVEESLTHPEVGGALGRATGALERTLLGVGQSYVDALVDAYEKMPA